MQILSEILFLFSFLIIISTDRNRCSHFLSVCYLANAIFKHKLFPYVPCRSGCVSNNLPIFGYKKLRSSSLIKYMHIGQDVPEE